MSHPETTLAEDHRRDIVLWALARLDSNSCPHTIAYCEWTLFACRCAREWADKLAKELQHG